VTIILGGDSIIHKTKDPEINRGSLRSAREGATKLKNLLTSALVIQPPYWSLPFEIMCDACDYAMGVVLGQRKDKKPYVIYYASNTLNNA